MLASAALENKVPKAEYERKSFKNKRYGRQQRKEIAKCHSAYGVFFYFAGIYIVLKQIPGFQIHASLWDLITVKFDYLKSNMQYGNESPGLKAVIYSMF